MRNTPLAVVASARLVRLLRGRGTASAGGQGSKFLILRQSRTVTSIIHSSTTCFSLYHVLPSSTRHWMDLFAAPFRNVGPTPLDRARVDLQQGPAEHSARSLRAAQIFF